MACLPVLASLIKHLMWNYFNGGLGRDSLKSNKNPNYSDEAQVAALVKPSSSARLHALARTDDSVLRGKLASIIITRKFCLIWEISEVQDVEGSEPEPGVVS